MNTFVNLMSQRALDRQCYHTRLGQWSKILALTIIALAVHGATIWWPARNDRIQLEALEAQYTPVRAAKAEITKLTSRISTTRTDYELELAISTDTPASTLLAIVGSAAEATRGRVFLEDITYRQQGPLASNPPEEQMSVSGIGIDTSAVGLFVQQLRSSMPFADIQVRNTETIVVNRQPMQSFRIDCVL